MKRWNPNLFAREGVAAGYDEAYVQALVVAGRKIDAIDLPVIYSLAHLARLAHVRYRDLHAVVSRVESAGDFPYRNFTIRKRSGGRRWISVPAPTLLAAQTWIAQRVLRHVPVHAAAYGYVHKKSLPLLSNAQKHIGASWLLHMDVKDFFSNISEVQVFRVFKELQYPDLLAFELARLCTRVTPRRKGTRWVRKEVSGVESYRSKLIGSLPQGAPTSPALSNLVCRSLDAEIETLARSHNATYTRYADDLCFSLVKADRGLILAIKREVASVLHRHGLSCNSKKTRVVPPGARKVVTGVVINGDRPSIPRELRDRIRMHLYYCRTRGIPAHCERKGFFSVLGFRNHLRGLIQYVGSIDSRLGNEFKAEFDSLPWAPFL